MLTCFLFAKSFEPDAILSVRLDMDGRVDQPLQVRTAEAVRALQENARTVFVLPTECSGLHTVELPWLLERKAREAIPFALEDQLAQSVSHLHFSIDRAHYQNNRYLVVVNDKLLINEWMTTLTALDIYYDVITIDWFALAPGEGCVVEQRVLLDTEQFIGALGLDVWSQQPHDWASTVLWYTFLEGSQADEMPLETPIESSFYLWVAEKLLKNKPMNLCQGEFHHDTSQTQIKRWYQLSGVLAGVWLLSFLSIHAGLLMRIAHKNTLLDQQIATAYHVFFPQAIQVVNPKVRVMQLLKQNQTGQDAVLWSLVEKLSAVLAQDFLKNKAMLVEELQFQNQVLTVVLACDSFAALEKMEAALQQAQVKVHQLSAATEAQQVVAKVELSL